MSPLPVERSYDRWRPWSIGGGLAVFLILVAAFPTGRHRLVIEAITGPVPLLPLKGGIVVIFLAAFWLWTRVPARYRQGWTRWLGLVITAGIGISVLADLWVGH